MEELGSSGTANRWPGLMPSTADHCDDDDDGDGDDYDDGDDMTIIIDIIILVVLTSNCLGYWQTIVMIMS